MQDLTTEKGMKRMINSKAANTMALDLVEPGQPDLAGEERVNNILPPEVTSNMLYHDVIHIAWPSMVELALTQLTAMVDLMMVGQLGPWAITSVGLTTQPKFLLMTMFMALNVGTTAMVARSKGAGDQERANLYLRQAFAITLVLSVIMSVVGAFSSEALVRFMGAADAETLAGGTAYLQIQMIGFVFMALTACATATLRGVGDTRTAMLYNMVANLVNVVLNYLLIYGHLGFPRMEVAGASLATIIGQFVAFLLAMRAIMSGKSYLHMRVRDGFLPDRKAIGAIMQIGIPSMVEQLVMRAGMIMYAKTVASLGTVSYATHQVCMNIQAMSFMIGQACAVSATSLVGQSLGKKRPDMAQLYASRTRRIGMAVSLLLGVVFFFGGRSIVSLYSDEAVIIDLGGTIMMFMAFVLPLQSSQFILAGALRGAGDTRSTAIISFFTILIMRPGLAYIMVQHLHWGVIGAWIALAFDQATRSGLVLLRYNSGKWKKAQA
jgi:putative MATE family efflux protein